MNKTIFKTLLIAFLLTESSQILAMEQEPLASAQPQQNAQSWSWFITHINVKNSTKKLTSAVSNFDPSIRIWDAKTHELILTLQRIGLDGKGVTSPSPGENVDIKTSCDKDKKELCEIFEKEHKILSLTVGGKSIMLYTYTTEGDIDLVYNRSEVVIPHCLIKLHQALFVDRPNCTDKIII